MPATRVKNVSRETIERLSEFENLVRKWSTKINLVSRNDLQHLHQRHIADSIQVFHAAPNTATNWLDLGSGGGFPGLVCAILALEKAPNLHVTLVEADIRKSAFLTEASRILGLNVLIRTDRIENLPSLQSDIISARALAPLSRLLSWSYPHVAAGTKLIFPKGKQAETELTQALSDWNMTIERIPSETDPSATVLVISDISPRT